MLEFYRPDEFCIYIFSNDVRVIMHVSVIKEKIYINDWKTKLSWHLKMLA